jgi:anthranilate synthase component 1
MVGNGGINGNSGHGTGSTGKGVPGLPTGDDVPSPVAGPEVPVLSTRAPGQGLGAATPTREEFRALAADRRVIPVVRRLLADDETPLGVYRKLAGSRPNTFLLESAENGQSWSRWSFVGVRSDAALTVVDGEAAWLGNPPVGLPTGGDPLAVLRETMSVLHSEPLPGMPPLTGGMVGYLSYDSVRRLERLPELAEDDLRVPELIMLLTSDLAALDHHEGTITLIANAVNWDDSPERVDAAYDDAVARLDDMTVRLCTETTPTVAVFDRPKPEFHRRRSQQEHHAAVNAAKEAIKAGEAFQVVVSQRFEMATTADSLDIYRVLRTTNPSPYMYLLRLDGFDIVGCSPEALVTVRDGKATTHPIAGTRWRGVDPEEDALLEKDLLADAKERAEHLMLVDLGRNDLGRVCRPGTVRVVDFFRVERYSHVMHIVSTVTGELAPGRTAFDAVAACFPAGTLSGAPKPRAMELIEELEPTRRGIYGGVVGYLDFAGDADTAITIRTAMVRDGMAYVQAGGGIVADSDPAAEDDETLNKARAVLSAIASAATMVSPVASVPPVPEPAGESTHA